MGKIASLSPTYHCIGASWSLGAPASGPERGPGRLLALGILSSLRANGMDARLRTHLQAQDQTLGEMLRRLADETAAVSEHGDRVLVLGGDHSMAAGSWRGIGRGLGKAPGLLWIDAHLDAHTAATSPSGNAHGMPVAALLGQGDPALTDIPGPPLDPSRIALVGARSWEDAELDFLLSRGVRIFTADEIARRGLAAVIPDAVAIASADGPWGLSLDLDVIDPRDAPGVSTPVPDGIAADALIAALRGVARGRYCVGVEIAEYNPARDADDRTGQLVAKLLDSIVAPDATTLRRWEEGFGARNYEPLPVVLTSGAGCWLTDVEGHRYLDFMSAYSATSFGHGHPRLLAALTEQAGRLAVTSRAFHNDRLPRFLRRLTMLTGYERALPVNTGLEAVETALKAARKWAYKVKGVPEGKAEIIACEGNFHGRSIAIVGLSTEAQYRDGFGPFPEGLRTIPYGDPAALAAAITPSTAAFLVEPIQGEGGIIVPPLGYLAACAAICHSHGVLFIADEVQTGLGRTGALLACQHEHVRPDGVILGKALGGGLLPVSAFLADQEVMGVFSPGDHGSTFGGNALAAAVGLAALDVLEDEGLVQRSAELGERLLERLKILSAQNPLVREVRGRGLFAGIEFDEQRVSAHEVALRLLQKGVLTRDTHGTVLRLAPPLIIGTAELDWGLARIAETLDDLRRELPRAA